MSTEALKSTVVTNLDAVGSSSLPAMASPGSGGAARLHVASGFVTGTTAVTVGSTYQLVRVRSDVKLKHVFVGLDATVTAFSVDIGFYYSTAAAGVDGTVPANAGTAVNSTTGSQLLGAAKDIKTAAFTDFIGGLAAAKREQPLWQACGLSVDPGGYFDLVLTGSGTTTGAPVMSAEVQYVR